MPSFIVLRWALLLAFPLQFLILDCRPEIYWATGAAMLSLAYLLLRLNSVRPQTAAVWMILIIWIVFYVIRYPALLINPASAAAMFPRSSRPLFLNGDKQLLDLAYMMAVVAFSSFCLTAAILLRSPEAAIPSESSTKISIHLSVLLVLLLTILIPTLGYIAYRYNIGQMGFAYGEPWPFHLKGIIFYGRYVTLPILILTLVTLAMNAKNNRLLWLALIALAIHALSDTIIRGSRSSLILSLLLCFFLFVSGGLKVNKFGKLAVSSLTILFIWLMPAIMKYREFRLKSPDGIYAIAKKALVSSIQKGWFDSLTFAFEKVYFRIPGIDALWAILQSYPELINKHLWNILHEPSGVAGYFTYSLLKISPLANTLWAPGFVGWVYLVGGVCGLLAGGIMLAAISILIPRWLFASGLALPTVWNTFFLWIIFVCITDGAIDSNSLMIVSGLLTLGALEIASRLKFFIKATHH